MKPRVVLTNWVHEEVIAFLEPHCDVVANQTHEPLTRREAMRRARDAHGLMVFMPDQIDAAFLDACPQLRIVAAALKGYDNFDVGACTRRGVWFTIVPTLLAAPGAELIIGLLIGLGRHLLAGDEFVRAGQFTGWRPHFYGIGLKGRTLGMLGMGEIGRALAARLIAFDMRLLYTDLSALPVEDEHALRLTRVPLDALLARSDFLVPLVPLSGSTFELINRKALQRMKRGSYLINVARGSVVDEGAVADALAAGQLAGYAADVFAMEDWGRADRPAAIPRALLANRRQTLFTPHLGSAVDDVRRDIALEAATNIVQVLRGEVPRGALNHPTEAEA